MASKSGNRLMKEFQKVNEKEKIPGVTVELVNEQNNKWIVTIQGPALEGTLYNGSVIKANVNFPDKYPHHAPEVIFNPVLLHIAVTPEGSTPPEIPGEPCLELLQKWAPTTSMPKVISELIELIKNPDPSHARNNELASLKISDNTKYENEIKKWAAAHKA